MTQCSPSPRCHVSRVTCRMSHVTCHKKGRKKEKKKGQSGGAYQSRVCYQRGLPRLVCSDFNFFSLKVSKVTNYKPKMAKKSKTLQKKFFFLHNIWLDLGKFLELQNGIYKIKKLLLTTSGLPTPA